MSLTLDDSTAAANPGNVRLRPGVWIRHFPREALSRPVFLLVTIVVAATLAPCFWAAVAVGVVDLVRYWARLREHFLHGAVNPGVVVALDPLRVAVGTDLSFTEADVPAVKVIEVRLRRVAGRIPRVGDRVSTVALYDSRRDLRTRWSDLHPYPVECATDDAAVIARVLATIPDEDWALLDTVRPGLTPDTAPGLYLLGEDGGLRPA